MGIPTLESWVVGIYAVSIFVLAQWVSRERGEHKKNAQDYFLASRALPWWAIGTSLIAANISAEQIIGMSGSGYVIGLGIASYEWMSALTLIIVGKFFLPVFLTNRIYTMPEFLQKRFSPGVRTVMAVFWLGVYVFVNLTAILWLGATAVHTVARIALETALVGLALFFPGAFADEPPEDRSQLQGPAGPVGVVGRPVGHERVVLGLQPIHHSTCAGRE